MAVQLFLQHPGDYQNHFEKAGDLLAATSTAIAVQRWFGDNDHTSVMNVTASTLADWGGVSKDVEVYSSMRYVIEAIGKCDAATTTLRISVYDVTAAATLHSASITTTTWSNYYHELTTSSSCNTLRVLFETKSPAGSKDFYVDDFLVQGNAFMQDPNGDQTTYNYDSQQQLHYMQDGSRVIDSSPLLVNIGMSWPVFDDSDGLGQTRFTRLIDYINASLNGEGDSYFDDGAVPAAIELGTIYTEVIDNFADFINNLGYYAASSTLPIYVTDFQTSAMTTLNYYAIDEDDSNYLETTASDTGDYLYHKFKFDATAFIAQDEVRSFALLYKGLSVDSSSAGNNGVVLYVWNANSQSWIIIDESFVADKSTLSFTTTKAEIAGEFWESGYVYVLARSRATKASGYGLTLRTYFVELTLNDDYGETVVLQDKAILDSGGDVISVRNLTDNTTLTLGTDYSIRYDRRGIVTFNETQGDLIEVEYNRYYKVKPQAPSERRYLSSVTAPKRNFQMTLQSLTGID